MEEHRSKTPGTRGAVRENARWWEYWHSSPLLNTEHRGWLRGSGACAAQGGPHLEGHVLVLMLCCHCQILDHFWKWSPRFLFSTGLYKLCTLSSDVFEKTVVGWLSKYRWGQAAQLARVQGTWGWAGDRARRLSYTGSLRSPNDYGLFPLGQRETWSDMIRVVFWKVYYYNSAYGYLYWGQTQ